MAEGGNPSTLSGAAVARPELDPVEGLAVLASGSSAEIVRRQPDGAWLYVIDHAAGAALPRVDS